jgi:ABC-type transport system involved in multi-copper enzyme maturation permease subunit
LGPSAFTIARYTVLEALRNRLLWLVLLVLAIGFGATLFLKQIAIAETREIQTAFLAAAFRLAAVFVLAAFIITSQVREANDKVLELLLARALPRPSYFSGKLLGYVLCALALAILFSLPLFLYASGSAVVAWGASLFLELCIVAAASLFCVLTLNQIVVSMAAVFGFYVLARSMAVLQLIGSSRAADGSGWLSGATNRLLDAIAFLLPRLDSFTQTSWLVYGEAPAFAFVVWQSAVYTALLALAAMFDLYRKNF